MAVPFVLDHFGEIGLGYQIVESASFQLQNRNPHLYALVNKVRGVFDGVSSVLGLVNFGSLVVHVIDKIYLFTWITPYRFLGSIMVLTSAVSGVACLLATMTIVTELNSYFRPAGDPQNYLPEGVSQEVRQKTTITWDRSASQTFTQVILGARTVVNIALLAFTSSPYFLLAAIGLQTASLIATARWKTLKYSRIIDQFNRLMPVGVNERGAVYAPVRVIDQNVVKVFLNYFHPLFPAHRAMNEDCAAFCAEGEGLPMSQVCSTHAAHDRCIVGSIYSALEQVADVNNRSLLTHFNAFKRTRQIEDGRQTHVVYSIRFAKEALPKCPGCRGQPINGEFEIEVEDREHLGDNRRASVQLVGLPDVRPRAAF